MVITLKSSLFFSDIDAKIAKTILLSGVRQPLFYHEKLSRLKEVENITFSKRIVIFRLFMNWFITLILIFLVHFCAAQSETELNLMTEEEFQVLWIHSLDPCVAAHQFTEKANLSEDSSLYWQYLAHRFAKKCPQLKTKGEITYELGYLYMQKGENAVAEPYFYAALHNYMSLSDTAQVASIYKTIGVNNKRMSRFIEALEAFNSAAHYYHLIEDKKGIASIELNIGLIHKNMNRFEDAKKQYHIALGLFEELNDNELIADCYNNLGNVFNHEENMDSARYYMYKTLRSRQLYGPENKLGYIYHNLANMHLKLEGLDSAEWYLNQSIEIKKRAGNKSEISSDYYVYGNIYQKKGDDRKAIEAFQMARFHLAESVHSDLNYDISLKLGETYLRLGDYRRSAENFALYFEQRNDHLQMNDPEKIETELILYEFFKDSLETEKLVIERELQEAKYKNKQLSNQTIRSQLYFISSILCLLILMGGLLFYSFRKRLRQAREHRIVLAMQNEELKRTLVSKEEKETLLKEIHHRVKNNLQIISSLVRLQSDYINEHNFKERLNEIESRILSMALVHEKLYQSNNLSKLVVKSYIRDLSINILESYQTNAEVNFVFDIDSRELSIDTLIPFGLILNEVISNALKHGFYERKQGAISISLKNGENNESILLIQDNGIGADLNIEELKEDSLGMELIFSLTEQLEGKLSLTTHNGFAYKFWFPNLV